MKDLAFVHIIESPSDEDMLDGRTEGNSLESALNLAGIRSCYNLVTTENSLQIAFSRVFSEIEQTGMVPILHFSMHGHSGGIGLTNNKVISWEELCYLLMPIQELLQDFTLDLLICMSSCQGSFGSQMAQIQPGQIPFKFLIGNRDSVPWDDAAVAYITFYHLFFKGFELDDCCKAMRLASGNNKFDIYNGEQVHLDWINYNRQKLIEKVARIQKQRRIHL